MDKAHLIPCATQTVCECVCVCVCVYVCALRMAGRAGPVVVVDSVGLVVCPNITALHEQGGVEVPLPLPLPSYHPCPCPCPTQLPTQHCLSTHEAACFPPAATHPALPSG